MSRNSLLVQCGMGLLLLTAVPFIASTANSQPQTLTLAVQPVLTPEKTIKAYAPLASYLSKVTGKKIVVKANVNFLAYWSTISKAPKYDFILDAAHFTDYRIKKMKYIVLAKIPDGVSYSIITLDENLLLDPEELIGKRVATLGSPSIGAARLDALFPNPLRQPIAVEIANVDEGIKRLLSKNVYAAILPTPIVSREMAQGKPINVVTTTRQVPHIALSASPSVNTNTREIIRKALVNAHKTADGKAMLKAIGFAKFDPAKPAIYAGQSELLKAYWGY
jgi:ABC transporter, phosphonate, periplasmic substrate-binding protein